jgi:hypothetical protein
LKKWFKKACFSWFSGNPVDGFFPKSNQFCYNGKYTFVPNFVSVGHSVRKFSCVQTSQHILSSTFLRTKRIYFFDSYENITATHLKMFFANFGLFKQFQVVKNVGKGRKTDIYRLWGHTCKIVYKIDSFDFRFVLWFIKSFSWIFD